jgi:hypothetical protein
VYFIEELYLYTKVGSSGRDVPVSGEHVCARTVTGYAERGASCDTLLVVDVPGECPKYNARWQKWNNGRKTVT